MRINYSPFTQDLHLLSQVDLEELVEKKITEGWYIEYKSRIPVSSGGSLDNLKICKTISSFANTEGGWIFWGVECENNAASELCGIDISGFRNFQDQVSQIISSNITPRPIYHFKEIPLSNGLIIFTILVEPSPSPPYITSQGIIYQRENNESKPIKERYILEKLNEKAKAYVDSIERFSQLDLGETKGQSDSDENYLELYLFPKPFDSFLFKDFLESVFFKKASEIFKSPENFSFDLGGNTRSITVDVSFNSIFSTRDSIIIRPLSLENMIYKSTTLEIFKNGNLKFTMPIAEFDVNSVPDRFKNSTVVEHIFQIYSRYPKQPAPDVDEILDYSSSNSYLNRNDLSSFLPSVDRRPKTDLPSNIKMIDGARLIFHIMYLIEKYGQLMDFGGFEMEKEIGFRARITSSFRRFVFFDSEDYLSKIKLYNLPLSPKNGVEIPTFEKGRSYTLNLKDGLTFLNVAHFILEGIGLPDSSEINFMEIISNSIESARKDDTFDE